MTMQRRFQCSGYGDGLVFGPIPEGVISRLRETDGDWKEYVDALDHLTKIATSVRKRRPYSPDENKALLQQIRVLAPSFALFIGDLRSSLVKEVCSTLSTLSETFGASFVAQIEVHVIPALLKRTCTSKAVVRDTAKATALSLFKHGLPAISNPVAVLLRDTIRNRKAAPSMRQAASQFVGMFLVEPTSAPSPSILSALEESILAGVEDPDETVRSQSRENWLRLAALDEPTAAALLDRISWHVVPHLEGAFEDEYGRRLVHGEETVTLTAFDRPVRAGQADSFRGRPGPVRAVQPNSSSHGANLLTTSQAGGYQEMREGGPAPVRAPVRSSTPARLIGNPMDDSDSNNVSIPTYPLKPLVGHESSASSFFTDQPSHPRLPSRPRRAGPPVRILPVPPIRTKSMFSYSRVQTPPPPARTHGGSQPIRACNGALPIRVPSVAPPVRVQSGLPPVRASATTASNQNDPSTERAQGSSLSTPAMYTPSLNRTVGRNLRFEGSLDTDADQVSHESQSTSSSRAPSILPTNLTVEQGSIATMSTAAPDTLELASARFQQGRDPPSGSVSENVTSPELLAENMTSREPDAGAASASNDSNDSSRDASTKVAPNDNMDPRNSPSINDVSNSHQHASSSLPGPAASSPRIKLESGKDENDVAGSRFSCPAVLSPHQSPEIFLNKGRLSFILGANITPRRNTLNQWTRSRFDLSNPDHFSSPESMGRPSGDIGLSVALGDQTGLIHIASATRHKRGISAPDLDSDVDRTPVLPDKFHSNVQTEEEHPVKSASVDMALKKDSIYTEGSLVSSTVSTAQEILSSEENCSSGVVGYKEATVVDLGTTRIGPLDSKEQENLSVCNGKSGEVGAPQGDKSQDRRIFEKQQLGPTSKSACITKEIDMQNLQSFENIKDNHLVADPKSTGDKSNLESNVKNSKGLIDEVSSGTLRVRRATTASGAPVLGKDRLTAKTTGSKNIKPAKQVLSRRPPRHSAVPVATMRNKQPVGTLGTVQSSTHTANRSVTHLKDRGGPRTVRATLCTRLPRSVVTAVTQKAIQSNPPENATTTTDENASSIRSLTALKSKTGGAVGGVSTQSQNPKLSNMAIMKASLRGTSSEPQNSNTGTEKRSSSGMSRMIQMQTSGAVLDKAGRGNRRDSRTEKPPNLRAAVDSKRKEETPSEQLHSAVIKLRSVAGRGRGDWSSRLERMKDVKESLQTIDRDNLNTKVAEDCVLVIGDMVNDGHHRVVVAALDSLFLLLLRVEGEAESVALQRVLERKADVLRKVLHLCKDSKEDIRLACQRVLQSFEIQFAPEVQVGLLLRAMGIEADRGGRGRKSLVRVGYSNSIAAVGSEVRVLESGCRSLVKAYERAERCGGGFLWSAAMLEMMLLGLAKLAKDKHVEIRRGADAVVKAVQRSLPDTAFDLACHKYGVKFACMESDGNDGAVGTEEGKS